MTDPVLLEVTRGDLVESRHRGRLVLLDAAGEVDVALGDVEAPGYARSSLKPLQATAMLESGFEAPSDLVALAAASHSAEPRHLAGVARTLDGAGLTARALQCPPALPRDDDVLLAYVRDGGAPARICHNCSGKHAAMLATCVAAGWDPARYLEPEHPLQVAVAGTIERLAGEPIAATSVDGCGAPAHALSLRGLAVAFAALTTADVTSAAGTVAAAMREHPYLVGGAGRPVSELMDEVGGLLAKDGAEGVWGAALPDGRAFAAKTADGSARALGPLLAAALRFWGYDGPAVRRWSAVAELGGGRPVGAVQWAPDLRAALDL